jgi:uncharacterized repeat protein (TIGR01451 family)
LVWQLGTLEAGAKREIVLVLAATSGEEVKNCARVQFEHGQCVATKIARPVLRIQKEGPTQAHLNDRLNYKITVTNPGNADLMNVQLTDVLPKGLRPESGKERLSWFVARLPPGQSRTIEYQLLAKEVGKQRNKVSATAEGGLRDEKESSVTIGEAKLDLNMTGPKRRYLNTPASYQITASNPGTAPVTNLTITDPLPEKTMFVRASEGGQLVGDQVQWSLGALGPGESRTVEVALRAQAVASITHQVTAQADRGLLKQAEVNTDFVGEPALSLEVEDSDDPVAVGGATTYNITVRNPGTKPVTKVQIVALVPAQMTVTRAAGAADHRKDGQKITYEPLTLQAGGEARYQIEVKANQVGDVRFKVELTADQLTAGPVVQEESTTIYATLPAGRKKIPKGVRP